MAGEVKGIGAYSEYTLAQEKITYKVPEQISFDDAATIPLACTTAWLALFSERCLHINRGDAKHNTLLVWGGSCNTIP
jgi:NADPH:quinone reductase-like Zn-dependent oxidoreductase